MAGKNIAKLSFVLFFVVVLGFIVANMFLPYIQNWLKPYAQIPQPPVTTTVAPPGGQACPLYGIVQDADTAAQLGASNTKIDVIDPNDWSKPKETITVATDTTTYTSSLLYLPGQQLYLHVYSTEGNGYYDALIPITVPSTPSLIGQTNKYFLPPITLKQRAAGSNINLLLYSPTGSVLSSTTDSNAGSQGTYTAGAKQFSLKVGISLGAYSCAYGIPMPWLTSSYQRVERKAVIFIAFNMTSVSASALTAEGWTPINNPPTGFLVFYKFIDGVSSTKNSLGSVTYNIPVDTSAIAASSKLRIQVWVQDLEMPGDAPIGVSSGAPSSVGAFSGAGVTSIIGRSYALDSSNKPTGQSLDAVITTA